MNINDQILQAMIENSQYGKPAAEPEFWFSFQNQKQLAYELAKELVLSGVELEEAIETSKTFIDKFYLHAIKNGSWER